MLKKIRELWRRLWVEDTRKHLTEYRENLAWRKKRLEKLKWK